MSVTEEPKVKTSDVGGGEEKKAPLAVAVNTENTQFSAGVLGGVAGKRLPNMAAIFLRHAVGRRTYRYRNNCCSPVKARGGGTWVSHDKIQDV